MTEGDVVSDAESDGLDASEIHDVLRNDRRRLVLERLRSADGTETVSDLSEHIGGIEADESPPPRNVRQSVYVSLHQTHLPKLDRCGVVEYESNRKTIRLTEDARRVEIYMEIVTPYGITWSEYYSMLGTLSLLVVLAALLDVPGIAALDPILWIVLFLGVFGASIGYQLWSNRWIYLNTFVT